MTCFLGWRAGEVSVLYESLTCFIPGLQPAEDTGDCDVSLNALEDSIQSFVEGHPREGLRSYQTILEAAGLKWDFRAMTEADVSEFDGRTCMALLIGAMRADHFSGGIILRFVESGSVLRWLRRLEEIDNQS